MEKLELEVLPICCVCKKIKIDNKSKLWLKREDDPISYDELMERFDKDLSHTYCPKHFEELENHTESVKKLLCSNKDSIIVY